MEHSKLKSIYQDEVTTITPSFLSRQPFPFHFLPSFWRPPPTDFPLLHDEMSLTLWHFDTLTPLNCLEYWISISCKALQCIQRAIQPLFLWNNGRVDGRKNLLLGAFRIVLGLHLSIFGVSDLPILGSNLGKTGVQCVIFSQSRTNTDKYGRALFFMSYLCTVRIEWRGRVFPLLTPTNPLSFP